MAMRGQLTNGDGYGKAVEVTAGPGALANGPTDAIYVGAAGDVTVTMMSGDEATFTVTGSVILPLRVTHVTAGDAVVALYW